MSNLKISIVNVVATATLNRPVDLEFLREHFPHEVVHDTEVYGGRVAYFKSSRMQGKVSIFASGKMISVGAKSEERALNELELAKRFLVENSVLTQSTKLKPEIHNIVVKADFGETIDIEKLSKDARMIYEPEQFPGAIMKIQEPHKATILLFASGKAVITGLKRSDWIKQIVLRLANIIKKQSIEE